MNNKTSPLSRSARVLLLFVVCPLVLSGCPQLLCDFGISDLCETYGVIYIANGADDGSTPVDSSEYQEGDTVTALTNSGGLALSGYSFDGWNTVANGAGTSYSVGATFKMGSADVTLYAQWSEAQEEVVTYTVTYNSNGGTGGTVPSSSSHDYGTAVTVSGNTGNLARTGYSFTGWNTAANGTGTSRATGSTFTMGSANVTLYAQWSANTYTMDMISVPTGSFQMGWVGIAEPVHTVVLSGFQIAKYEVTYDLWHTVRTWAESNGYTFSNPGREGHDGSLGATPTAARYEPVTTVSWRDAIAWCNALSEKEGMTAVYYNAGQSHTTANVYRNSSTGGDIGDGDGEWSTSGYRLPTEAEWEYAARYVDGARFTQGDWPSGATASGQEDIYAWYLSNSGSSTHPVGRKASNGLGVYDMGGNIWEWCWDWYGTYDSSAQTDPVGPAIAVHRLGRGGSWDDNADNPRTAHRYNYASSSKDNRFGFRPARKGL